MEVNFIKGMVRVSNTLKDKGKYKGMDKDMNKDRLIKFPKASWHALSGRPGFASFGSGWRRI